MLGKRAVDLLILDCRFPRNSGPDRIGKITRRHPNLPILLITSYSDAELAYRALQAGASSHLFKPIDFEELLSILDLLLGRGIAELCPPLVSPADRTRYGAVRKTPQIGRPIGSSPARQGGMERF